MSSSDSNPARIYFPALDGLRFVAFLLVFLFHRGMPQVARWIDAFVGLFYRPKVRPGQVPWSLGQAFLDNGWIGVQLFFILSGFLITTLLLSEERKHGRVDLPAFWMRRILRIWPLYYLTVFLVFGPLPLWDGGFASVRGNGYWSKHIGPFVLFAGNWSMAICGPVPYDFTSILWSVCVEEQFYLVAPLLIAWTRRSWRIPLTVGLMGLGIYGRYATAVALAETRITPVFFQFSSITHVDTLLAGVLLAVVRDRWTLRTGAGTELLAGLGWVGLMFWPSLARGGIASRTWDYVAVWAVGSFLVLALAAHGGPLFRLLSRPRVVWLGRISYGLYMFHEIAFYLQRRLYEFLGWFPFQDEIAPWISLALTIGLAQMSYTRFETPFLRLKNRWTRVSSRPIETEPPG